MRKENVTVQTILEKSGCKKNPTTVKLLRYERSKARRIGTGKGSGLG